MQNKKINLTNLVERKGLYPNLLEYISSVKLLFNTDEEISAPLMYLIRHSIEIGLKSSILYLCEKSDLNSMCTEEKLEGHELARLYNCFNQHWQNICSKYDLKNQGGELKIIVKDTNKFHIELKELIYFYDELDKSSTFFRYGNQNLIQINSNYSFIIEKYSGTIKHIDVAKLIKKYENSMLVFKYLEDALYDYFIYLDDMNNELTQEISYWKSKMVKTIFSKKVQNFIINDMSICIHDLANKIIKDTPNSHSFFNDLFEYMITLKMPYIYDYNNLSNPNNKKSRQYLEEKLYEFLEMSGFTENSKEYTIFDPICHCFINFKEDGIVRMYKNRLPEFWYPKIIVSQFIGIKEHIDELDDKVLIFRGTSQEEYNSGIFGQSWSLSKTVAERFAFSTYENIDHYKNTLRVVLSTTINKNLIYFYDKDRKEHNGEDEVIINTKHLSKEVVKIEENNFKRNKLYG